MMSPEPGTSTLSVRGLTKSFGRVIALDAVTIDFEGGEFFCILGPSGCGKTTLLRLIAGFEQPTGGEIQLGGRSLLRLPPERRPVNMVFQHYALFPHMTVFENVAFGLTVKKLPREVVTARVREILRLIHLDGHGDRYPRQLSGGQQQRVALARALVNHPTVLLLDEPLAALDEKLRLAMQRELKQIQRELGITFIHVTHSQDEALTLADRLAVMDRGRVVQIGSPRDVYERPANRFVAEFLGSSNLVGARPAGAAGWIETQGGLRLRVADGRTGTPPAGVTGAPDSAVPAGVATAPSTAAAAANGGRTHYLIRPEHIRLSRRAPAPPAAANVLRGTVREVRQAGPKSEYAVEVGELTLVVHAWGEAPEDAVAAGEEVFLQVLPEHVVPLPEEDARPQGCAKPDAGLTPG